MDDTPEMKRLSALLSSQGFGVLSTEGGGAPYASLVAFAATGDRGELLFATPRGTRKYGNLKENPRAALLVDDRSNTASDLEHASAVTAVGVATELSGGDGEERLLVYLARHPKLAEFARDPSSALFMLKVEKYVCAWSFQDITVVEM
jgi:nitroimidazol reductase NimA-like FMN-containing flavoprotein (pyridoxamine 5'-phosphate oxidase superfamily)